MSITHAQTVEQCATTDCVLTDAGNGVMVWTLTPACKAVCSGGGNSTASDQCPEVQNECLSNTCDPQIAACCTVTPCPPQCSASAESCILDYGYQSKRAN